MLLSIAIIDLHQQVAQLVEHIKLGAGLNLAPFRGLGRAAAASRAVFRLALTEPCSIPQDPDQRCTQASLLLNGIKLLENIISHDIM